MNCFVFHQCVLLLMIFPTLCPAGDSKPKRDAAAIEKVAAASLGADRKLDWEAYVELVHPESLEDFKNMWLPVLKAAAKEGRDKQADLLSAFDKATDLKTVMALKPKEFFVCSMKGMSSQLPGLKENAAEVEEKIIGTVREGSDLAHVVVRTRVKYPETDVTKVDVITLKRSGNEWKLVLPDAVRVMAEAFKRTQRNGPLKSDPISDRPDPNN